VIEGGSAEVLDNSTVVQLESKSGSVDSDGDWSFGGGVHESNWVVDFDIGESGDCLDSSSGGVASTVLSSVWIAGLSVHGSLFSVLESIVHESTITSLVSE